jgi:hypothetical protein
MDLVFDARGKLGGLAPLRIGHPLVVARGAGVAVLFDGANDALELPASPLEGLSEYTVEVLFRPDAGGQVEQRFFHAGTVHGDRLLFETRPAGSGWCLDAYVQSKWGSSVLIDRARAHSLGDWHTVAAVVGAGQFASFVDGEPELSTKFATFPPPAGRFSLGCRLNRVSWFRGAIARVRVTSGMVARQDLLRPGA